MSGDEALHGGRDHDAPPDVSGFVSGIRQRARPAASVTQLIQTSTARVRRPHAVGQRADRHEVRARLRVRAHVLQRDSAGRLDLDPGPQLPRPPAPGRHRLRRLIVHQQPGRAGRAGLLELLRATPPRRRARVTPRRCASCERSGERAAAPRRAPASGCPSPSPRGSGPPGARPRRRPAPRRCRAPGARARSSGCGGCGSRCRRPRPRRRRVAVAMPRGALQQVEHRPLGAQDAARASRAARRRRRPGERRAPSGARHSIRQSHARATASAKAAPASTPPLRNSMTALGLERRAER